MKKQVAEYPVKVETEGLLERINEVIEHLNRAAEILDELGEKPIELPIVTVFEE